jgi:hypothetical protein
VPATDDVYLSTTTDTGVLCRQERMRAGPKNPLRHVRYSVQLLDAAG